MSASPDQASSAMVAAAVVRALRDAGVREAVLAPGSRSAGLALALRQADVDGLLRLHVRIDERSAAFLALGLAKGGHRPTAVVTTSGTAVANLHPAVLEAHHGGQQLIVLTADRPAALRGTGANQTTDQVGVFGAAVVCSDIAPGDVGAAVAAIEAAARRTGPSQINLQFGEPLLPDSLEFSLSAPDADPDDGPPRRPWHAGSDSVRLDLGPRTVVVAGDDAGPSARMLAQSANWPLLAEPTSGARTGSHAIRTYRLLLGGELFEQIERVVVTGHPTLSRPVTRLISRADMEVISVRGPGSVVTDPGRVARHLDTMPTADGRDDDEWIERWRSADLELSAEVDRLAAGDDALALRVAASVGAAVVPEGLLFVGSSQPVRDLDVMAPVYDPGRRRLVIGNRGLAGIDGAVSTAIGAALGRQSSRALAYLGDLTFLHDANGLVIGQGEPRPDLTVVVANDDGGAIFATLEQGAEAYAAGFERVFGTPTGVDLESLCRATRTRFDRIDDAEQLAEALAQDQRGIRVIEVPISRVGRRTLDEQLRTLV